jgi:hypothetical protein
VECGLGKVCDIRAIKGELGMRSYLTKYLVKHTTRAQWPRYQRRVQHSVRKEPRERQEPGVWLFEPKPKIVPLKRPDPPFHLAEELELGECERRDPLLPWSRPP